MNSILKNVNLKSCLLIVLILIVPGFSAQASSDVTTHQSENSLIVDFKPQNYRINTTIQNNRSYYDIKFNDGGCLSETHQPQIPFKTLIVGVPFGAQISLTILTSHQKEILEGKILPAPEMGSDNMAQWRYFEDAEIYSGEKLFPRLQVEISELQVMRGQQVVILHLYPVLFNPATEQIYLYDQIKVQLDFSNFNQTHREQTGDKYDPFYDQVLINPQKAAKWRRQEKTEKKLFKSNFLGDAYKIYIDKTGMYKITGQYLSSAGLDISGINPTRIKIFNNGGLQLPVSMSDPRPDSLIENAIFVHDGGDGKFDSDDYLLFFGKSVNGWKFDVQTRKFSHYLNSYNSNNVYWLCWQDLSPGKRMRLGNANPDGPVTNIDSFTDRLYIENELTNLLNSGTCWLGHYFSSVAAERNYVFDLNNAIQTPSAKLKLNLVGISNGVHRFSCYFNDHLIMTLPGFYGYSWEEITITRKEFLVNIDTNLLDGYNQLKLLYHPTNDEALAYVDWLEVEFQRQLKTSENLLHFYSPDTPDLYRYKIQNLNSDNVFIFDITSFFDVSYIDNFQRIENSVEFGDSASSNRPKEYLLLAEEKFKTPQKIERDNPSSWRSFDGGADFLIITFDDFYDAVIGLKSLRENCDSLKTEVIKISDVFDEFSCGLVDPAAIRDFIKYTYDNWQPKPKYVLLFGDGDYDYKNRISSQNPNWLPPFETSDLNERASRARDDWYVCVDGKDDLMDLAIGRIAVRNFDQAQKAINKIINFHNFTKVGEWCNKITMIADDELGQGGGYDDLDHIPDAEQIAETLIPQKFQIQKIYLTEYPAVRSASISGIRKPAATADILRKINDGSLVINFIGHANERLLTHEHVLHLSDHFFLIENGARQAFWIAATCGFGRFDDPEFQCFAEELVNAENRGAIGVFSACRSASATDNVELDREIFRKLFSSRNKPVRLGDVVSAAKNSTGNYMNDQFYHLLGDPTTILPIPNFNTKITKFTPDSLRALDQMQIFGSIENPDDSSAFLGGQVLISAFDSRKQRVYEARPGVNYYYKLPGNTIFRGFVSASSNQFTSRFFVPKDISYGGQDGRICAFYWDEKSSGSGYAGNIKVGGTRDDVFDSEGPLIEIFFQGQNFQSGSFLPTRSTLKFTIEDHSSGVNIAGDLGHKISLILDNATENKIDLTSYFQYDLDSFTKGSILYELDELTEGDHKIEIKAWDNANNSSKLYTEFTLAAQDKLIISDLYNYPNPFSTNTEIYFCVNQDCQVAIKIYTIAGRLIRKFENLNANMGFNYFLWDGFDQDYEPLANGVYLYKVNASCYKGTNKLQTHEIQKCAVVR